MCAYVCGKTNPPRSPDGWDPGRRALLSVKAGSKASSQVASRGLFGLYGGQRVLAFSLCLDSMEASGTVVRADNAAFVACSLAALVSCPSRASKKEIKRIKETQESQDDVGSKEKDLVESGILSY